MFDIFDKTTTLTGGENQTVEAKMRHYTERRLENLFKVMERMREYVDERNDAAAKGEAKRDDEYFKRRAAFHREMADILLEFPNGLPPVAFFESKDYEVSRLHQIRDFFLIAASNL